MGHYHDEGIGAMEITFDKLAMVDSKELLDRSTEAGNKNFLFCQYNAVCVHNPGIHGLTQGFLFHLSPDQATFNKFLTEAFNSGASSDLLTAFRSARGGDACYVLFFIY